MRRHICALLAAAAIALGLSAVSVGGYHGSLALWSPARARACGITATVTMLANKAPALSFPLTPNDPPTTPTGIFALDYTAGQTIAFTEDLSRLPTPVNPAGYGWNWDFGDGAKASGYVSTHTYTAPGTYTVRVGIVDLKIAANSDPNFDSAQIHVTAQPFDRLPIARATASSHVAAIGQAITYDASGSRSQVGGALTYTWNFGDSKEVTGLRVSHVFSIIGQGFVTLIVQDSRGAKSIATVPIFVATETPTANVAVSATRVAAGSTVSFDASASTPIKDVPGDTILNYRWDFGDGTTVTTVTPTTQHVYHNAGTYQVFIDAIDKNGVPGEASVTIAVYDGSYFGLGSRGPLVLGGGGLIVALLALGIGSNLIRERREAQRRLARKQSRSARRR